MNKNQLTLSGIDWEALDKENQFHAAYWGLFKDYVLDDPYAEKEIRRISETTY